MDGQRVRSRLRVEGIVQGVGFRPFVHGLATRLGLAGLVGNDAHGVFVEVEGSKAAVEAFHTGLEREAPPLAVIERVTAVPMPATGASGFEIVASRAATSAARWSRPTPPPAPTAWLTWPIPATAAEVFGEVPIP